MCLYICVAPNNKIWRGFACLGLLLFYCSWLPLSLPSSPDSGVPAARQRPVPKGRASISVPARDLAVLCRLNPCRMRCVVVCAGSGWQSSGGLTAPGQVVPIGAQPRRWHGVGMRAARLGDALVLVLLGCWRRSMP